MSARGLVLYLSIFALFVASCATTDHEFETIDIRKNTEFDKVIKIETIAEPVKPAKVEKPKRPKTKVKKSVKKKEEPKAKAPQKVSEKKDEAKSEPAPTKVVKPNLKKKSTRMPKLEDDEGFDGRRPLVDPVRVGEELVLGISYFAVEAGKLTMKVKPMVQVNGRKAYHYQYLIQTSSLFSMFYSVDDVAEAFVDYETLVPYSYEIHVDESKQKRETKTYFDWDKNVALMWDKKKQKGKPVEEKKVQWDILKYSQNVFSVAYYLRAFTLEVGKELKVRVAHEGKNIIMTAKVIRKEKIFTDIGAFDTFVVSPRFDIDGKFKPTGENYLWLTDDERKFIVKMESKIKIGSIMGKIQKIKK
ncbi:MAG: DUF3108 domain-containing protein [Bdellovibrionales bacterium]|nr:DUF3108 domain-containing protein [Bdellovibrionales bacterium]